MGVFLSKRLPTFKSWMDKELQRSVLTRRIKQIIRTTFNAEQPLPCDIAHTDSDSNDEEMQDVHQRRLEKQESFPEC
jgi:hypothetical protein